MSILKAQRRSGGSPSSLTIYKWGWYTPLRISRIFWMIALMRCENSFSSVFNVAWQKKGLSKHTTSAWANKPFHPAKHHNLVVQTHLEWAVEQHHGRPRGRLSAHLQWGTARGAPTSLRSTAEQEVEWLPVHRSFQLLGACCVRNRMSGRCRASAVVMAVMWGVLVSMHEYREGFVRFDEYQPRCILIKYCREKSAKLLTFFNKPRTSTGNIFMLSEIESWALAPAPLEVILLLYATKMSTRFLRTKSLLSSNLWVSDLSTALFAR